MRSNLNNFINKIYEDVKITLKTPFIYILLHQQSHLTDSTSNIFSFNSNVSVQHAGFKHICESLQNFFEKKKCCLKE